MSLGSVLEAGTGSPGPLHTNLGVAPRYAKGTRQDYLTHVSRIPAEIMAVKPVFSEVVKTESEPSDLQHGSIRRSVRSAAARGRRFDPNPTAAQAYQRTGQGLFQLVLLQFRRLAPGAAA